MKKGFIIAFVLSAFAFCTYSFAQAHFVKVAGTQQGTASSTTDTDSDESSTSS